MRTPYCVGVRGDVWVVTKTAVYNLFFGTIFFLATTYFIKAKILFLFKKIYFDIKEGHMLVSR